MESDDLDNGSEEFFRQRRNDEVMENIAQMLEVLSKPQVAPKITLPKIEIPAPVVHVQAAAPAVFPAPVVNKPILDWTFTFDRNKDGTIKSIRAKATT